VCACKPANKVDEPTQVKRRRGMPRHLLIGQKIGTSLRHLLIGQKMDGTD